MIIDFHTHAFPDHMAAATVQKLAREGNIRNESDGTKGGLQRSMEQAGIGLSLLLPIATKPTQTEKLNRLAAEVNAGTTNTHLASFGTIHPDNEDPASLLRQAKELGLPGIKLHPYYQGVAADDVRMLRIVELAEELGLITLFHAGLDVGFEGQDLASPERFYRLYQTLMPKRLVLAHMGGWRQWERVEELLCPLPIYFDCSYVLGPLRPLYPGSRTLEECRRMSEEQFLRMIRSHGTNYVLFGSDSPWSNQKEALDALRALPLSNDEIRQIFEKNACKLLQLSENIV